MQTGPIIISLHHRNVILSDPLPATLLVGRHSSKPVGSGGLVRQLSLHVDVAVLRAGHEFGRAIGLPVDSLMHLVRRALNNVSPVHGRPVLVATQFVLTVVVSESDLLARQALRLPEIRVFIVQTLELGRAIAVLLIIVADVRVTHSLTGNEWW